MKDIWSSTYVYDCWLFVYLTFFLIGEHYSYSVVQGYCSNVQPLTPGRVFHWSAIKSRFFLVFRLIGIPCGSTMSIFFIPPTRRRGRIESVDRNAPVFVCASWPEHAWPTTHGSIIPLDVARDPTCLHLFPSSSWSTRMQRYILETFQNVLRCIQICVSRITACQAREGVALPLTRMRVPASMKKKYDSRRLVNKVSTRKSGEPNYIAAWIDVLRWIHDQIHRFFYWL